LSVLKPIVAILATINTKSKEVHFIANVLKRAGATLWIVDLSMKPHNLPAADITGEQVAGLAGTSWFALDGYVRQEAAAVMVEGGTKLLLEKYTKGDIAGAIGIGGANGTNLVCSIMRALPYLLPKVMVSTVAGTAAVQCYVAESDIVMYPSIGDHPQYRYGFRLTLSLGSLLSVRHGGDLPYKSDGCGPRAKHIVANQPRMCCPFEEVQLFDRPRRREATMTKVFHHPG
jgi:hypothetical protein